MNFQYQEEIKEHFRDLLDKIAIALVPHHGASRNWNSSILHDISNPALWVVSAGIHNRYGHPGTNVVHDILINNHCFAWSNEFESVIIKGEVEWK